jgi:crotonobetainyl-CoA:carnitine CoA-transferase CaiB-like acyl-CoA transferase
MKAKQHESGDGRVDPLQAWRSRLAISVPTAGPRLSCAQDRPSRKAAPMRQATASKALAKYKVLDLTRARAGPTAVRQLADWGAQVLKIERPGSDDTPDFMDRHSPDFQNLHRNKRSMTLNLQHPDGRAIFLQLARDADVIVENYRPDVKHRLGIDYEAIKAINPRIVYGSISGFGQDGPYADRPGVDPIVQGMGGHMMVTGEPGRGPMRSGAALSDVGAGLLCANGILTALLERETSGQGQWVQASLIEAMIFLLDFQAARWTMAQDLPAQVGNNHPTNAPMGVFRTQDGYITIAASRPMWRKLCVALGAPELLERPEYASAASRVTHREALNADIERVTQTQPSAAWIDILNHTGVPCGPIYTLEETFNDPQVQHLGIAQTVESPTLGPTTIIGQAFRLSRTPSRLVSAAPECGADTDAILGELGYDAAAIAALRARQVI